jgi:iron(III) transport system substrate-binding protein
MKSHSFFSDSLASVFPTWMSILTSCGVFFVLNGCTPSQTPNSTESKEATTTTSTQKVKSTPSGTLTLYSGRKMSLIEPLIKMFEKKEGVQVQVRSGKSTNLAQLLINEGKTSEVDVFWSQDPEAMALLEEASLLAPLPKLTANVYPAFSNLSPNWIATSGRLRVLAYHEKRGGKEIPDSIFDLVKPQFKGRVGWAPTNASFQTFVTAARQLHGDEKVIDWLKKMMANGAKIYPKNTPIIAALDSGDIDFGLPNHYYLLQAQKQGRAQAVKQTAFKAGDVGNLMSVAAIGQLKLAKNPALAQKWIEFLLSEDAQRFFADKTMEYPLLPNLPLHPSLQSAKDLEKSRPNVDLKTLKDRKGTLKVLQDVGLL